VQETSAKEQSVTSGPVVESVDTDPTIANSSNGSSRKRVFQPILGDKPLWLVPAAKNDDEAFRRLRAFHAGTQGPVTGPTQDETAPFDALPALLWPYRDQGRLLNDYPIWLESPDDAGGTNTISTPLRVVLKRLLEGLSLGKIFTDNVLRLDAIVRQSLAQGAAMGKAKQLLRDASKTLAEQLQLRGDEAKRLEADISSFLALVPEGRRILGYCPESDILLAYHVAGASLAKRRATFAQETTALAHELSKLLTVEVHKSEETRSARALAEAVGEAGDAFVNSAALAKVLGAHRGSTSMPPDRRTRIEQAVATLRRFATTEHPLLTLVHEQEMPSFLTELSGLHLWKVRDAVSSAANCFQQHAEALYDFFRAVRVARLELASPQGTYQAERHDAWLANLDWRGLTRDELLLLPTVVALSSADRLAREGLQTLSQLLLSGRPVQVLARTEPGKNPGSNTAGDSLEAYRLELGYFGISHREALVWQSTAARPGHLAAGFVGARESARPALHLVSSGLAVNGTDPKLGSWIHAGTALESRAHPFFGYDPEAGTTWARRVIFADNPAPEHDWPSHPLTFRTTEGEERSIDVCFTFADFALLEPSYRGQYCGVDESCSGNEHLLPIADYLALDGAEAGKYVPFVWAVDANGRLRQMAVSRRLAHATRDRQRYWRTLQELAGIRNEHVEQALAQAKNDADLQLARVKGELQEAHQQEIGRVKRELAGELMDRLATVLLGLGPQLATAPADTTAMFLLTAPPPAASTVPRAEVAAATTPLVAAPAAAEEVTTEEPWIETALCTSCNDCLTINQLLFIYDGNKQAIIGNARAGTFAQLVQAAEKCPARCIHPGQPLNPNEAGLEALIKRAAPFND
jgi:ferredoxin